MQHMPAATLEPWPSAKSLAASIAWPMVWPKFRIWRSPRSRSSASTTSRLIWTLRQITSSSSWGSKPSALMGRAARRRNSASSRMTPCLMTSPHESVKSSGVSVSRQSTSATTSDGWKNAPARFLPASRSTAVFPPTEESTMARRDVGTCTTLHPRRYSAAASPPMSPVTPPPTATTTSSRVSSAAASPSSRSERVERRLCFSPAGNTWSVVR